MFDGHSTSVEALKLSTDGRILASVAGDGIALWNINSRKLIYRTPRPPYGHSSLAFSPNEELIIDARADGRVCFRQTGGLKEISALQLLDKVESVAWSPNGRFIAVGDCEGIVRLYPLRDSFGTPAVQEDQAREWHDQNGRVYALVFSPDGSELLSAGTDGRLRIRSVGAFPSERFPIASLQDFAFVPGTRLLAVLDELGNLTLWDRESLSGVESLGRKPVHARSIAVSPDGRLLALAGHQSGFEVWDLKSRTRRSARGDVSGLNPDTLHFSPDGGTIVALDERADSGIRLFAGASARPLPAPRINCNRALALTPDDGRLILADDGYAVIYDLRSTEPRRRIRAHTRTLDALDVDPTGTLLATGSADRLAKIWDLRSAELRHALPGHQAGVVKVQFAHDGRTLVTLDQEYRCKFWHVETGRELMELRVPLTERCWRFRLSSDGRMLGAMDWKGELVLVRLSS